MDRLTVKFPKSNGYTLKRLCSFTHDGEIYNVDGCQDRCYKISEDCDKCPLQKAFNRLAEYEDAGLTPDEITALKAFKEYFDDLYGKGLEVANWHFNGALEAFDSFMMRRSAI